ncbi:MAG: VWA domain-containing protein [Acidobacteria bacterium]|nr:VWA domain-containing protein [Acidobacteriota bacterium]
MNATRRLIVASPILAAQEVTFRADVKLVRMLATVKDANGALIAGLEKEDFAITDNGAPQEIAHFERQTAQPLSVAMLVDTSGSTAKDLKYEIDSLKRFSKALFASGNVGDQAALFTFNHEVLKRSPFTRKQKRIEDAANSIKAEAGTSLYDAILLGASELKRREGRRVIVVITDGGDTTSQTDFHAALEAAHANDAVIYSIVVVPVSNDAGRNVGGENALTQFSNSTGGRFFLPSVGAALDKAFDEILRDLRTQYLLTYYPKNVPLTRNRFHAVKVGVGKPGLRVQTRSGYYGEAAP